MSSGMPNKRLSKVDKIPEVRESTEFDNYRKNKNKDVLESFRHSDDSYGSVSPSQSLKSPTDRYSLKFNQK